MFQLSAVSVILVLLTIELIDKERKRIINIVGYSLSIGFLLRSSVIYIWGM